MRILVTGACGFIGSHFVRRLATLGDQIVVLDRLTYAGNRANLVDVEHEFIHGDIADQSTVSQAAEGCEAVVNFAAETHVDRSLHGAGDFVHTNVFGVQVLLEWTRASGARLVHVSTDEVYGDAAARTAFGEDDPLNPSNPYAASKAGGDLQVLAYVHTFGADALLTRGGNAYGPFQHPEKFIPLFITRALEQQPLPLYGDGRQRRSWVHVEDQVAAIDLVLRDGQAGETYNIGGEERENFAVAKLIVEFVGADMSLIRHASDRPGHDRMYRMDSSKVKALGWQPTRRFEEGLSKTVAWYGAHRDWWEPRMKGIRSSSAFVTGGGH
jgi:dTDP-glucose 4,6-dehydratase